jgi:hypothetical protein
MHSGIAWKIALLGISALQGSYMLFDGTHHLLTGSYFGSRLGPWADLVAILGIAPGTLAPVFVAFGAAWLIGALALLLGLRWSRLLLTLLSVVSLAYLVFGTLLSVASLAILLLRSKQLYGKSPSRR